MDILIKSFLIILLTSIGVLVNAQQLTNEPSTYEYGYSMNPGMNGIDGKMSFGGIYRKQWVGFTNSPQHLGAFVQYPFRDYNISSGGYLIHDREGPFRSSTIGLSSAYKLKETFQDYDELSIGIGLKFNTTNIQFDELIPRDQQAFDDKFKSTSSSSLEFDLGAYYVSDATEDYNSRYFGGFGINNLKSIFNSNKVSDKLYSLSPHYNMVLGYKYRKYIFGYKKQGFDFFIKPILWLDYAAFSPLRILIGADLGMEHFLYGGLYFSNESTVHLKLGLNLDNEAMKDGVLKVIVYPSYNFGQLKKIKGFNFDIGVSYSMMLD